MNKIFLITTGLAFTIGCAVVDKKTDVVLDTVNSTTIDLDYMNTDVRAQDDFFQFSNGTWVENNPVPESESRWGSFNELTKSNMEKLTSILEIVANSKSQHNKTDEILGNYYSSFNNVAKRNELGLSPIQGQLDAIAKIKTKEELPAFIASQHKLGIHSLFYFGVSQDLKDVENNIVSLGQGGIGMPNRDYYFNEDKEEIKLAYTNYIGAVMTMLKKQDPEKVARRIVEIETQLAGSMMTPSEMRVPENRYNKMKKTEAIEMFGGFSFEKFLATTGIGSFEEMNIGNPGHVKQINAFYDSGSLEDWKDYLLWTTMNHYAGHLDNNFVELNFNFYSTTLSGTKRMKASNERAIDEITNMEFGELLGKAFVEQHYSAQAQERVNEMVDNLLVVFQERIKNLEWMSDETKKQALLKLNSIGRKLGFPEKWTDFSSLKFTSDAYIANYDAANLLSFTTNIKKLGKPVNKFEWGMPAHMVNAYYHPLLNEIAFPAGIMQPPFFDASYEDAVNYGRIGMVIGHEFTHGFDDMGSKFAADGSFTNWWTEGDRSLFEERTEKLGNTFANFCPIEGHCVNPQLTMGENIADLGGLTLAYYAYTRTAEFKSGLERKGYSPAQRFFIAYAQLWKINYTEEELKKRIATDPHSPGTYRVNGPLMNCPEFFEAFALKESDPMRNSKDKISKIW